MGGGASDCYMDASTPSPQPQKSIQRTSVSVHLVYRYNRKLNCLSIFYYVEKGYTYDRV